MAKPPRNAPTPPLARLAETCPSVETALGLAGGVVSIDFVDRPAEDPKRERRYSERLACPNEHDISIEELEPRQFSFNAPWGACPTCSGLGTKMEVDVDLVDAGRGVIWRKVGRREPAKALRKGNAALSAVLASARVPAADRLFPATEVDRECRPYELGWLLYAWNRSVADQPVPTSELN